MNQNSNSRSNVRSICSVTSLARRLDACVGSQDYVGVVPAMRRCVESDDYEMIRHAHRVLREPGDEASAQWLRQDDGETHEQLEELVASLTATS